MAPLILEPTHGFEEGLTASVTAEGDIRISVAEEQAGDSYNESFTCSMHLTKEQAVQLRDWLSAAVS